jgi:DNA-binding PadR family transcriptional regulator
MGKAKPTKYAILSLLSLEPMSGYDMKKLIDVSLVHFWSESYGQLYPTLRALESEKLVTSRRERGSGKPDRIVYTITRKGRWELKNWLRQPADIPRVRYELLLKLFVGSMLPVESNAEQIRLQRRELAHGLSKFRLYRKMVMEDGVDPMHRVYFLLTIRHGEMVARARIRWCDEALKILGEVAKESPDE